MTVSFQPLDHDAMTMLEEQTGIDFRHVDFTAPHWLCATDRDGERIRGIWISEFTTPWEAHVTMVVNDPRCVTRRVLRAIFTALFTTAVRVTFMTRPENQKAIAGIRRLGAQYEGYCRMGLEGRWDALVFGMLKDECAYLPGYVHRPRLDAGIFASETLQ